MRTLFVMLALGMTALVGSAVLYGPAFAGQNSDNVIALPGPGADSPAFMLVKGGYHHHHGGGFFGGFYLGSPYGYGYGYYPGWGYSLEDGEGYFTQGKQVCEWTGYEYKCFKAYR